MMTAPIRTATRCLLPIACAVLVGQLVGCAAFHPIGGVPASYLPEELKPAKRSGKRPIDLSLLAQPKNSVYRLDSGDTLGIYIEGILGKPGEPPPVYFPQQGESFPPSLGYPIPVREDGTISMPLVGSVSVRGLTISEVEQRLKYEYSVRQNHLKPTRERIFVSLQRPRTYRVLVLRQEQGSDLTGASGQGVFIGPTKRGTGQVVDVPAYKNDVLNVLSMTSGLPGLDAENAVYIVRNGQRMPLHVAQSAVANYGHAPIACPSPAPHQIGGHAPAALPPEITHLAGFSGSPTIDNPRVTRIPIRLAQGEPIDFTPADVLLYDGDVVFVESLDSEVFYTGGLLGGGEYSLPRDRDLDILEAISIAQATNQGQGGGQNVSAGGPSALNSDVSVSASSATIIRRLPNGSQFPIRVNLYKARRYPQERVRIQPRDFIILEYSPAEAFLAFFERNLLEGALFGVATGFLEINGDN